LPRIRGRVAGRDPFVPGSGLVFDGREVAQGRVAPGSVVEALDEAERRLCRDVALLARAVVPTPELRRLLALGAGHSAIPADTAVTFRLAHPIPGRLRRRLGLAHQVLGCARGLDQLHHLLPELRRAGHPQPGQLGHLRLKPRGAHGTGTTPTPTPSLAGQGQITSGLTDAHNCVQIDVQCRTRRFHPLVQPTAFMNRSRPWP
jgi:hypothetical protein